jgi:hypothetical protein
MKDTNIEISLQNGHDKEKVRFSFCPNSMIWRHEEGVEIKLHTSLTQH